MHAEGAGRGSESAGRVKRRLASSARVSQTIPSSAMRQPAEETEDGRRKTKDERQRGEGRAWRRGKEEEVEEEEGLRLREIIGARIKKSFNTHTRALGSRADEPQVG
jgi:hypothetical protein